MVHGYLLELVRTNALNAWMEQLENWSRFKRFVWKLPIPGVIKKLLEAEQNAENWPGTPSCNEPKLKIINYVILLYYF